MELAELTVFLTGLIGTLGTLRERRVSPADIMTLYLFRPFDHPSWGSGERSDKDCPRL